MKFGGNIFRYCLVSLVNNRVYYLILPNPDKTYSKVRWDLGWFLPGFTSVLLYHTLNRYSTLFGIMFVAIIIIFIIIINYIYLINIYLII